MEFLKGILASVAAAVVCGFCPKPEWVAFRCIESAVNRMPKPHQERMREEWHAELADQPGGFWTLFWSIDLLRAAGTIAKELEQASPSRIIKLKPENLSLDKYLISLYYLLRQHNEGKINVEVTCRQIGLEKAHISNLIRHFEQIGKNKSISICR